MALQPCIWVKFKVIASSILFILLWNNPYTLLISMRLIAGDLYTVVHNALEEIDQWRNRRILSNLQISGLNILKIPALSELLILIKKNPHFSNNIFFCMLSWRYPREICKKNTTPPKEKKTTQKNKPRNPPQTHQTRLQNLHSLC